jgi:hypothetical protein
MSGTRGIKAGIALRTITVSKGASGAGQLQTARDLHWASGPLLLALQQMGLEAISGTDRKMQDLRVPLNGSLGHVGTNCVRYLRESGGSRER